MSISDCFTLIMANGEEPPATVSAQLPPATQGGAVSTVGQGVVSTSTPTIVTASTVGMLPGPI